MMISPTYHPYWQGLVGFIYLLINNDIFNPLITSERQGGNINVQQEEGPQIGSIFMEKILPSTNNGEPIRQVYSKFRSFNNR